MTISINDNSMSLEIDGAVISTARRDGAWWFVTNWQGSFTRDQAITALTLAELLAEGYGDDHPAVIAFRQELLTSVTDQHIVDNQTSGEVRRG